MIEKLISDLNQSFTDADYDISIRLVGLIINLTFLGHIYRGSWKRSSIKNKCNFFVFGKFCGFGSRRKCNFLSIIF